MARSRAKTQLNFSAQGQRSGRCRVNRRAERVIRRTRAKTRHRRVLVVTVRSPGPIHAVQRARLWAITCTASQAALAAKRPDGRWLQPDAVLEAAYGVLDLGVAAMIGLQVQHFPIAVGDEAVIAVFSEESQLGTGRGLHSPDNEPHRCGAGLSPEGGTELVSEVFSRTNIVIKTASNYGRLLVVNTILSSLASIIRMSLWSWTSETSSTGGLRHIGGAVHPVGDRRPVCIGNRLDQVPQAFVLADGDGEADIHLTTVSWPLAPP